MSIILLISMVIVFILILLATYYVLKQAKIQGLEPTIINLITEAEANFKSGEGAKKFEYVFDKLYNNFAPKIVKILFTPEEIRKIIQYVFDKIKIALDYREEQ